LYNAFLEQWFYKHNLSRNLQVDLKRHSSVLYDELRVFLNPFYTYEDLLTALCEVYNGFFNKWGGVLPTLAALKFKFKILLKQVFSTYIRISLKLFKERVYALFLKHWGSYTLVDCKVLKMLSRVKIYFSAESNRYKLR